MERKTFPNFSLKIDADQGIVEHIFAVFGNLDLGNDVLHPGSFAKTIVERGNKVRVLDQHNMDSVLRALGKPLAMREISRAELPAEILDKYPEATGGVWARTQFLMETPEGKGAFIRIKEGAVDEWSFAYDALDVDYSKIQNDGREITVRNIRTIKLYEYSPVLWGMNPATATLSAKEMGEDDESESKTVSGSTNLPLAPRGRAWDAGAAEGRVRAWAEAEDSPNAKYRQAFFWYDAENAENFTAHKLPFADVIDGELHAVPRGVFACAGVMMGSRGGVDIPEDDMPSIRRRVARYYARMRTEFDDDSIVPPWEKATARSFENKAINLSKRIDDVVRAFYHAYPDIHDMDNRFHVVYWVKQIWDEFLIVEQEGTAGNRMWKISYIADQNNAINFALPPDWVEVTMAFIPVQSAINPTTAPGVQAADEELHDDKAGPAKAPPTSEEWLKLIEIEESELTLIEVKQ